MPIDLRQERRTGLLGRSDTLALLEIFAEKARKQVHTAVPVVIGKRGMGRTAVLIELADRFRLAGRASGYGCVRSGLGQAVIDATTSLAESVDSLDPGSLAAHRLVAAADAFQKRSPDESTEEDFMGALDHLLYALSNEVSEIPNGMFVAIDDLHLANEGRVASLLEGLVALSSTGAPIPMVLTSASGPQIRPVPIGLDEIELRALTNADLADIAQRRGVIASPEIIRMIGDYVAGRPGYAIQVVEQAAAKGIVDAHTVRAVIAEAQAADAARADQQEAERMAALVRTAPTAGSSAHLSEVTQPVLEVAVVVPVEVAEVEDEFDEVEPVAEIEPELDEIEPELDEVLLDEAPKVQPTQPMVAPAPVNKLGAMRFQPQAAMPQRIPTPPQPIAVLVPLELGPTERRVLQRAANIEDTDGSVSVPLLKRALGEVSRFAGADSPVADALTLLIQHGLLTQNGKELAVTAVGRQTLS
jgi:hypothetical protein